VLNRAPLGFLHSVLRGKLLFARDEERLSDLIEVVARDYMVFAHHRCQYLREILQGLAASTPSSSPAPARRGVRPDNRRLVRSTAAGGSAIVAPW
jgi:hypothetical protein